MLNRTTTTYSSHGPDKRSHQKKPALAKFKGAPLLKFLTYFCVLDCVSAHWSSTHDSERPSDISLRCYAARYSDLRTASLSYLAYHWVHHGKGEGRFLCGIDTLRCYAARYSDLNRVFCGYNLENCNWEKNRCRK